MRQLYRMHCYNRHNILVTIAINCIGIYRNIGLIAIFSGSEDQNIALSAILFFQCSQLGTPDTQIDLPFFPCSTSPLIRCGVYKKFPVGKVFLKF